LAEEFIIKSEAIEDKINQLLPSQGGFQAGVDFSASTMVIPIVDLTETAEGSALRLDLQKSFSHNTATVFAVNNTTTTVVTTTGYFRIIGTATVTTLTTPGTDPKCAIILSDGTTDKEIWSQAIQSTGNAVGSSVAIDLLVKLDAGDSLKISSNKAGADINGSVRQIADLSGNLTNP
tara:strand:+ start:860 stop:1390 length:531 start_codon:yes stop_codon:yes gene_type:complete